MKIRIKFDFSKFFHLKEGLMFQEDLLKKGLLFSRGYFWKFERLRDNYFSKFVGDHIFGKF